MQNLPCCNSITDHQTATKCCKRHDSTAVMPRTKFCSNHLVRIWMRVKWNFHHIWTVMENILWNGPLMLNSDSRFPDYAGKTYPCFHEERFQHLTFLHDWPRIKSISSELDIIIQVIVSQLSGHCGVISNRLRRHQQNENRTSETWGGCVKIVVFIVIYGFVLSCKK